MAEEGSGRDLSGLPPRVSVVRPDDPGYSAYRRDVVLEGHPDAVLRPRSEAETKDVLRWAGGAGIPVTAAGGQTSLTGSSVALDGILLATEKMDRFLDLVPDPATGVMTAIAEPGIFLGDFKRILEREGWLYPPDPTSENEARLGATVATNATGEDTLRYGPTRRWIRELRVVKADGEAVTLRRSPGNRPPEEKATAGYYPAREPIDLVIGSEGTLGIVTRVTVDLVPLPPGMFAGAAFFPTLDAALRFVVSARRSERVVPRALELLDRGSLDLVEGNPEGIAWPEGTGGAILFKQEFRDEAERDRFLEGWLSLIEGALPAGAGEYLDRVLFFESGKDRRRLREFRHRVPARLNECVEGFREAGGGKLGTDWWVPYERLPEFLGGWMARIAQAGLEAVAFGHVGNGHPHVNFLPRDRVRLDRARDLVPAMCREAVALGGGVAGEHGIGKIKRALLGIQHDARRIEAMRAIKSAWDPGWILAPGNLFEPPRS
jgi:glycolate oxidase